MSEIVAPQQRRERPPTLTMAETVDDSFLRANEAIAALKKTRPRSVTEARNRAVELSRLNGILLKATRDVAETQAQAR